MAFCFSTNIYVSGDNIFEKSFFMSSSYQSSQMTVYMRSPLTAPNKNDQEMFSSITLMAWQLVCQNAVN